MLKEGGFVCVVQQRYTKRLLKDVMLMTKKKKETAFAMWQKAQRAVLIAGILQMTSIAGSTFMIQSLKISNNVTWHRFLKAVLFYFIEALTQKKCVDILKNSLFYEMRKGNYYD